MLNIIDLLFDQREDERLRMYSDSLARERARLADALAGELLKLDEGTTFLQGTTARTALYAYLGIPEPE